MLRIEHIRKQYENHLALDDVSILVPEGSVYGLLGPNGAGKTSLIRIINQITAPDRGEVFFKNEKLQAKHIQNIGYLPEERGLYKKMEIGEQVLYLAQLKGLSRAEAIKRAKYWFEKMEIQSWWKKKVEELSKGMQQKVQFIATIIHEPELLILDEPFSGFDPVNAEIIKNEFLELNQKGTTIIFSSHRMESVEQLCNHIALINKSKKILEGSVHDIRQQYKENKYAVQIKKGKTEAEIRNAGVEVNAITEKHDATQLEITLAPNTSINDTLSTLLKHFELISFEEIIPSIHDIFITNVTQKN
jgi:ABC-2 type transport system ATP-binding protein